MKLHLLQSMSLADRKVGTCMSRGLVDKLVSLGNNWKILNFKKAAAASHKFNDV